MSFFRRIYLGITRRPFRSSSLLLLIIIISLFGMIGNYLRSTVSAYESIMYKQIGLNIGISNKNEHEGNIPKLIIDEIAKTSNILGYNATFTTLVNPNNFRNLVNQNNNEATFAQMDNQKQVRLIGNITTSLYDTFRRTEMKLIAGKYPDEQQLGVLIDEYLAVQNNLHIGSDIQLVNPLDNTIKTSLTIVGIYQTLVSPEENWVSGSGLDVQGATPYSYLFCNLNSYDKVMIEPTEINFVSLYVNESKNLNLTLQKIKKLPIDWNKYRVENITQSNIVQSSQVIQTLNNTAKFVLTFSYISSIGILLLVTLLWMRDHLKETGIYVALGTNRLIIALHFFIEVFLISILGLTISLTIGYIFILYFKEEIIQYSLTFSAMPIIMHNDNETNVIDNSLSILSLIGSNFYILFIASFTTLLSSFIILRYNPRQLFELK
jgi:ABC-type antimicrobial peptide transport system permease subunit